MKRELNIPVTRTCLVCSTTFIVDGAVRTSCCSSTCWTDFNRAIALLNKRKGPTTLYVLCGYCDQGFVADMADSKYCKQHRSNVTNGSQYVQTILKVLFASGEEVPPAEAIRIGLSLQSHTPVRAKKPKSSGFRTSEHVAQQQQVLGSSYRESKKGNGFKPRTTNIDLRKVKAHQAKEDEFDFRCPEPQKKTYRTDAEARTFIEQFHPDDPYIRPYKCRCGAIHIGHSQSTRNR